TTRSATPADVKAAPLAAAEPGPITGDPDTYPEGIVDVSRLLTPGATEKPVDWNALGSATYDLSDAVRLRSPRAEPSRSSARVRRAAPPGGRRGSPRRWSVRPRR